MISKLKKLIKGEKQHFLKLCYQNNLTLNYQNNKNEFRILKSIFEDREYSDYFPFYKKATIIDIGAHFGYFSIFAKKNTDKNSSIIAIEPNKTNFVTLERNLKDCNITNIKCYDVGIGEKSGVAKLYQGGNTNHSIV